jgi:hypothetical protein
MARQWSARCYGVARQRDGTRQNSIGSRVNLFPPPLRAREGSEFRLSKFAAALTQVVAYRRATTGRAAAEL